MKKYTPFLFLLSLSPFIAHAASLQTFIVGVTKFLSDVLIPFILGIAFLFFVVNAVRYFVVESSSEDGREKAKALTIYSVSAFVLIIIFWGIINLLSISIGLEGETQPGQDYINCKTNKTC